jgi:uncharacterized protein YkwD
MLDITRYRAAGILVFAVTAATSAKTVYFATDNFAGIQGLPDIEEAVFGATNEARAAADVPPLSWDDGLAAAARQHSDEMKRLFYFSHDSPTSGLESVRERAYAAGVTDTSLAENLVSENSVDPSSTTAGEIGGTLVKLLLASEKHRENILDRRATNMGVGCAVTEEGTLFCTQVFSRKALLFKFLKATPKEERVLDITLKLKFDDEVGVWVDEEDVYVFQPDEGVVAVKLSFPLAKGVRKVAMARRVPGTFGPMTGFFINKFDPESPYKFSQAITEIDVLSEEQTLSRRVMWEVDAEGRTVTSVGKLKVSDGDSRFGAELKNGKFKAKLGIPSRTGVHEIFFVTDDEASHRILMDTDGPAEGFFRQGRDVTP